MVEPIEKIFNLLEKIENRTYRGKNRVTIELEEIVELLDAFDKLCPEEKVMVQDCVSEKAGRVIISFTGELAQKAIENSDNRWIRRAILAHLLEGARYDYRENIRELDLVEPALKKANLTWGDVWSSAGPDVPENVEKYLMYSRRK